MPRLGVLSSRSRSDATFSRWREAFQQGLRDGGYIEGQTITIEWRFAEGIRERLAALAAELVRLQVDIIYAETTLAALAAKQATTTIPIVFNPLADPVGSGLVASLARPGGNVTGMSFMGVDLVAKRLQLLKEAVPRASRMAVLWQPGAFGEGTVREMFEEAEAAARALGVQLRFQEARGPNDFNGVFSAMTKARAGALMLLPSPIFASERRRVVDLAAKGRLPTMYYGREYAEVGGLMAYGPNYADLCRRTATYVDKILKGAKPADLPVEQPMRFEFAINMKTAKALGLTFPPTILIRADQVIQ